MRRLRLNIAALSLLAASCASQTPPFLRETLPDNPALAQVNADVDAYAGRKVRWGGTVYQLENHAQETWLEIVERPLGDNGRPRASDQTGGRFIAKVAGFLDPVVYTQGREVTVTGVVDGASMRKIGEFEYRFPLLKVTAIYLWETPTITRPMYRDPYWYDPWYPYPYWPWWHRPYWY